MTMDPADGSYHGSDHDPFSSPRNGLPPREYWAFNKTLQCSAPGCASKRDSVGSYCRKHYRRLCSFGHLTKRHINSNEIWKAKQRARKLLDASIEARHPTVLAGLEGIRRLLAPSSRIHREAKHDYLARIAATADPREVIAETVAVCACLYRFDPQGYEDGDYLATQIAHRLRKLGPRRYANATGQKTMRRSKAMAGAVLEVIGPLVSLMVSTLERDRRIRSEARARSAGQAKRKAAHPNL